MEPRATDPPSAPPSRQPPATGQCGKETVRKPPGVEISPPPPPPDPESTSDRPDFQSGDF